MSKVKTALNHRLKRSERLSREGLNQKLPLNPCIGIGIKLHDRHEKCLRYNSNSLPHFCRHSFHDSSPSTFKLIYTPNEDWMSEQNFRKYTETDSRPVSPAISRHRSKGARKWNQPRKCITPEPDGRRYSATSRRVLILDLRKLKSVDVLPRQDSLTSTGTPSSMDSEGGAGDEYDGIHLRRKSLASVHAHLALKSTNHKRTNKRSNLFRLGQFPVAYEGSSSPKNVQEMTFPPLHSSVLTLLSQTSVSEKQEFKTGIGEEGTGTKQKKLRRHGRRRKSGSHENLEDGKEDKSDMDDSHQRSVETVEAANNTDKGTTSTAPQGGNPDPAEPIQPIGVDEPESTAVQSAPSSLYEIMEKSLSKRRWYLNQNHLNKEIEELERVLGKKERIRRTPSSLKDDLCLLLPKDLKDLLSLI